MNEHTSSSRIPRIQANGFLNVYSVWMTVFVTLLFGAGSIESSSASCEFLSCQRHSKSKDERTQQTHQNRIRPPLPSIPRSGILFLLSPFPLVLVVAVLDLFDAAGAGGLFALRGHEGEVGVVVAERY